MKYSNIKTILVVSIVLVISISNAICQQTDQLKLEFEELKKERKDLEFRITQINQRIDELNRQINNSILSSMKDNKIVCITKTTNQGRLRPLTREQGDVILVIPKKREVKVLEYAGDSYWKLEFNGTVGFLNEVLLKETNEMKVAKNAFVINREQQEIEDKKQAALNKKEAYQRRKKKLTDKYGSVYALYILAKKANIGMNKEMVIEALGDPNDKNISKGSWGIHEQWVYRKKKQYVYFENGKVSSIQY